MVKMTNARKSSGSRALSFGGMEEDKGSSTKKSIKRKAEEGGEKLKGDRGNLRLE